MPPSRRDSQWIEFLRVVQAAALLAVFLAFGKDHFGLGLTPASRNVLFLAGAPVLVILGPYLLVRDEWVAARRQERVGAWWKWIFIAFGVALIVFGQMGDTGNPLTARIAGGVLAAMGLGGFLVPAWLRRHLRRGGTDDSAE